MATGLKIWNAAGNLIVGPGTSLGIVLGYVDTGTVDGSISVPGFALGGTPFILAVLPLESSSYETSPVPSISGTTLSWAFTVSGAAYNGNCRIVYGIC